MPGHTFAKNSVVTTHAHVARSMGVGHDMMLVLLLIAAVVPVAWYGLWLATQFGIGPLAKRARARRRMQWQLEILNTENRSARSQHAG